MEGGTEGGKERETDTKFYGYASAFWVHVLLIVSAVEDVCKDQE